MIVMRSKQTGVAPLDIRCDTVVCSFRSAPWQSNAKFFPLESRINFILPKVCLIIHSFCILPTFTMSVSVPKVLILGYSFVSSEGRFGRAI